jgi:hypothetical protein
MRWARLALAWVCFAPAARADLIGAEDVSKLSWPNGCLAFRVFEKAPDKMWIVLTPNGTATFVRPMVLGAPAGFEGGTSYIGLGRNAPVSRDDIEHPYGAPPCAEVLAPKW